jgi:hypothetical protein
MECATKVESGARLPKGSVRRLGGCEVYDAWQP